MTWLFKTNIPVDVRLSFVRALYGNRETLWFGLAAHLLTCAVIYLKTNDIVFAGFAGSFALVTSLRMLDMYIFDRADFSKLSHDKINRWELHYLLGACAICLLLGLLCFYSTYIIEDSFAELASLAVLLASVVSIVGRNYASRNAVVMMSVCALLPVLAGFVLTNSIFHIIIGALLVPYFLSNIQMANGLRQSLFAAVMNERRLSTVVSRFDTALNNMPQGLVMLDGRAAIAVVNKQVRDMLNISQNISLLNRSFEVVLRYCSKHGLFPREELDNVRMRIDDLLEGRRQRDVFQFGDERYIEVMCNQRREEGAVLIFDDVTGRIEAEAQIQHMARYDGLTGLPNRFYFETLVRSLTIDSQPDDLVALVVIDLNHFKHVNDTYGHHAGDELLRQFAERMATLDSQRFVASRFGGDEFVLFIRGIKNRAHINSVMDEVISYLCGVYEFASQQIYLDISAGVAVDVKKNLDLRGLHVNADLALYEAKSSEHDRWVAFVEAMDTKYRSRQKLKNDLREAVRAGSLTVVYQPIVSLNSLRIVAVEALSRWHHPQLGPIGPADYIPLAEEMGIITELTQFMLRRACEDCASWGHKIGVSVNLSAIDLKNPGIVEMVVDALKKAQLPSYLLEVEVTESAIISDRLKTCDMLQKLKNSGINIALDDFGTGYSSLSYLNTLPLTKVKVDRSFVRDIVTDRRAFMLLRGVTQLSHELGFGVTIEGVETEDQLKLIRGTGGADLVQGFLLGTPLSAAEINAQLEQSLTITPKNYKVCAETDGLSSL